jgi:mono/diheme cytochrome c family protein
MKQTITAVLVLAWSGAAFAQSPPIQTPQSPLRPTEILQDAAGPNLGEAASGETIYFRYCAACHGKSLKGDGPVAAGLVKKPIDLTQLARRNGGSFPFDKVAAMIDGRQSVRMHGTPDMPVWGEIFALTAGTDVQDAASAVKRITHYLWSLQAKGGPPVKK